MKRPRLIEIDIIRMFLYQEKARAASVLDVPEEPDVEVVDLPFQFFFLTVHYVVTLCLQT